MDESSVDSSGSRRSSKSSDSSAGYYDPPSTVNPELKPKVSTPTLERQNSVDHMEDRDPSLSNSSIPDITENSAAKKTKKKKAFRVFRRSKKTSALDGRLGDSLPSRSGPLISQDLTPQSSHLSLDNSWNQTAWSGKLESEKKLGSAHSSNVSLLSAESEGREIPTDDEDLVECLVNPQRLNSVQDSPIQSSAGASQAGVMGYLVNITLMSGHGLAVRDRTGTSDPYVKFKCPPFKYRSAVIPRNLNPEWNEHFSFKSSHLKTPMLVRVYDHDYGSLDDFMGGQTLDLASYANGDQHIVELGLVDSVAKNENLGYVRICIKITPLSEGEGADSHHSPSPREDKKQKTGGSKIWTSVVTVTLLEGKNLPPMDQNGLCDPYCKFKLGSQKYKSKVLSKTLDPKWVQRFDLRMYDDCSILHIEMWDKDFPQNDDFIGMCSVDLTSLSRNVTHDFTLTLQDRDMDEVSGGETTLHFNLCITGTRVEEEEDQEEDKQEDVAMASNYSLLRSLDLKAIKEKNIGHLTLKIDKVVDLVPCNSYVLVELGNSCVKTRPIMKSGNPVWEQKFEFTVGDIHEELEIMVYKMGSRNSEQLLGKVKMPLHRLREGSQQFALKDKHCLSRSRGVLHVETEFVYNPVRAMIRTVNPRENKLLEDEQGFKKKVLMDNIKRVSNLVRTVLATVEFINSTWSWENKPLSATAFVVFLLVTYFGELWMLFFGFVIIFLYQYLAVFIRREHVWQKRVSSHVHIISNLSRAASLDHEESDFSDSIEDKHTSLRDKFRQFHSILILVQNVLGYIADMEEGVRNLLYWRVPFLGWMAVLIFMGAAVLFYLIPLRYVILIWGINKYTKKLRKPHFIPNNELFDFLSRCPNNRQLQQWQELPLAVYQKHSTQKQTSQRQAETKTHYRKRKTK